MSLVPSDQQYRQGQMARNQDYSDMRVSESGEGFAGKIPTVKECEEFNRRARVWLEKRQGKNASSKFDNFGFGKYDATADRD
tara:strand:- start:524 stop:769 length:246 start_codon:yes stop_codon:yes gene_type:complete